MTMIPSERADNYSLRFPNFPKPQIDGRWLNAVWMMGNNYKSHAPGFYGAYPPGYIRRISSLFPDVRNIAHIFSGSLDADQASAGFGDHVRVTRVDVRPEPHPDVRPDIVADVETRDWFEEPGFDLVLADPPYSVEDAEHYGPPLCSRKKVIERCWEALVPGGNLVWMDQVLPMYSKDKWNLWGLICIVRSTNHRVRLVSIMEKVDQ